MLPLFVPRETHVPARADVSIELILHEKIMGSNLRDENAHTGYLALTPCMKTLCALSDILCDSLLHFGINSLPLRVL